MTHVSTPNVGTLPRRRNLGLRSLGVAAVAIAIGAAAAFGVTAVSDDAVAGTASGNTFTAQREGQPAPAPVNSADWKYLNHR